MRVVYCRDAESRLALLRWISARIPHADNFHQDPGAVAIGVVTDTGHPAAGVVFNFYFPQDSTIHVSVAAINPLWTRGTIVRDILGYAFLQLRVEKVWAAMPQDLKHVIALNRKMGFTQEAILGKHLRGKNAVISRLYRKDYMSLYWPETAAQKAA